MEDAIFSLQNSILFNLLIVLLSGGYLFLTRHRLFIGVPTWREVEPTHNVKFDSTIALFYTTTFFGIVIYLIQNKSLSDFIKNSIAAIPSAKDGNGGFAIIFALALLIIIPVLAKLITGIITKIAYEFFNIEDVIDKTSERVQHKIEESFTNSTGDLNDRVESIINRIERKLDNEVKASISEIVTKLDEEVKTVITKIESSIDEEVKESLTDIRSNVQAFESSLSALFTTELQKVDSTVKASLNEIKNAISASTGEINEAFSKNIDELEQRLKTLMVNSINNSQKEISRVVINQTQSLNMENHRNAIATLNKATALLGRLNPNGQLNGYIPLVISSDSQIVDISKGFLTTHILSLTQKSWFENNWHNKKDIAGNYFNFNKQDEEVPKLLNHIFTNALNIGVKQLKKNYKEVFHMQDFSPNYTFPRVIRIINGLADEIISSSASLAPIFNQIRQKGGILNIWLHNDIVKIMKPMEWLRSYDTYQYKHLFSPPSDLLKGYDESVISVYQILNNYLLNVMNIPANPDNTFSFAKIYGDDPRDKRNDFLAIGNLLYQSGYDNIALEDTREGTIRLVGILPIVLMVLCCKNILPYCEIIDKFKDMSKEDIRHYKGLLKPFATIN